MRIEMFCTTCPFTGQGFQFAEVDIREDGVYTFTCSNGHKTTNMSQLQPFELLFEVGASAILDNYYREAVSSFTASLERFYGFAVQVLMLKAGKSNELFNEMWRPLKKQSERQLGAFVAAWSVAFGAVPPLLPETKRGFRNDVIHNGRMPSREEAVEFGAAVLGLLRDHKEALKEFAPDEVNTAVMHRLKDIRRGLPESESVGTICPATIISLSSEMSYDGNSFEEHLAILKGKRNAMASASSASSLGQLMKRYAVERPPLED